MNPNKIIYSINIEDVQTVAEKQYGRTLTDEELNEAKDNIHEGLSFDIDTVFRAAIQASLERTSS